MTDLEYLAAFVITVFSAARISRLILIDVFPPSIWLRIKWDEKTDGSPWNELLHCTFCLSPWVSGGILGLGWATNFHPVWWFVNGTLAAAYLAATYVVHDGED